MCTCKGMDGVDMMGGWVDDIICNILLYWGGHETLWRRVDGIYLSGCARGEEDLTCWRADGGGGARGGRGCSCFEVVAVKGDLILLLVRSSSHARMIAHDAGENTIRY